MSMNIILNTLIHILVLVLLFSFFINNKNDNNTIIFLLCSITIFLCYMIEFIKKPDIMKIEHFKSPIDPNSIGPYNKLDLNVDQHGKYNKKYSRNTNNSKCDWRKEPCDAKLLNNIKFTTPLGQQGRYVPDPDHYKTLPSVDGNKNSPKSMFMFTYNQCHPDCCPSTYSCDHGCACTNKQQRELLNTRGKNRSSDVYPGI